MLADLSVVFYLFIYNVPFAFLRYYPFFDKLRFPLVRCCCIYASVFLFQLISFFIYREELHNMLLLQGFRVKFGFVYLLLSFWLIKEKPGKHFFVYLMMFTYSAIVGNTANIIEVLLEPHFALPPYFITDVVIVIQLLLTYPLIYRFIRRKLMPLLAMKETKVWNYIWIIPFTVLIIAVIFGVEISKENLMDWRYYLTRCILGISFFSIYFILIKVMEETDKNATLHEHIRMTDRLLGAQANHYKALTEHIESARMARHDLRHHILVLQTYLQHGQYEQLETYLKKYEVQLQTSEQPALSRHYIVDAILQHYKNVAAASEIALTLKADIPPALAVADFDVCIILGNVLENAIEACRRMTEGERFISLHIKQIGRMLVLTLDNSHDGIVKASAASEALLSRKRSGDEEGVGLTSVRSIIAKYQGVLELKYTAEIFKTSIMLKLPEEASV